MVASAQDRAYNYYYHESVDQGGDLASVSVSLILKNARTNTLEDIQCV
jgi:hypothetical protein